MTFRRQRNKDICPLYNEPVHTSGGKYLQRPIPCCSVIKFGEKGKCQYLSQAWCGRTTATVQCRFKGCTKSILCVGDENGKL